MKQLTTKLLYPSITLAAVAAATPLLGQSTTAAAAAAGGPKAVVKPATGKPAWLTDLSVGVQESYDNNMLLVSGEGVMPEQWSWVTTVSPKVGINLTPLLGDQKVVQTLSFGYAPDFASYHNVTNENNNAHRIATVIKGKADAFTFNLDNNFVYIDASKLAPTYFNPDNARSAYATGAPRERRNQYQDRAKIIFQYDWNRFLVRPNASLLYYELLTIQKLSLPGTSYQNYADRYDVNGGLDLGFKINSDVALILGYRVGHQYQERVINTVFASTSDYQRFLLGVEGKPAKWLSVAIIGGPDFRSYADTAPVSDQHPVKLYGEASISVNAGAADTVAFKYKANQWVSSTGQLPYFESSYDLSWRHSFSKKLLLDVGGKLGTSDYTSGNLPASQRDDWMYTASAGLAYALNANCALNASFSAGFGRNHQDNVVNPQYREFDRYLTALGAVIKF